MTQIVDMVAFRGPTAQMVDLSKFTFWGPPQDMDFFYKQSTRTGQAWLKKIAGRTVSYNQLVQNGDFSDGTTGWTATRGTLSLVGRGLKLVLTGTPSSNYDYTIRTGSQIPFKSNHWYYIATFARTSKTGTFRIDAGEFQVATAISQTANFVKCAGIGKPTTNAARYINFYPLEVAGGYDAGDYFEIADMAICVDLTQAGLDSITTPEQFEEWQMEQFGHKGYIDYTPGKLVSVNPTGIKTTTPGGDEHTLPLDFTEHFPAGLNGVNDVVDEVYSDENGKFTDGGKRFGVVDMGDLTWTKLANNNVFRASLAAAKPGATNYTKANLICPNYYTDASGFVESNIDGIGINTSKLITVGDDRYTDAATFKAAVTGVPLVFELATPQHVTFTDPSDAVYPVTEGGTEQVLPVNGSEPTTGPLLGKVSYKQGRSAQ